MPGNLGKKAWGGGAPSVCLKLVGHQTRGALEPRCIFSGGLTGPHSLLSAHFLWPIFDRLGAL